MPDINQRPSSRRKVNLPKPSELVGSFKGEQKNILRSSLGDFASTSTAFNTEKPQGGTKMESMATTGSTTLKGRTFIKRGPSKKKT